MEMPVSVSCLQKWDMDWNEARSSGKRRISELPVFSMIRCLIGCDLAIFRQPMMTGEFLGSESFGNGLSYATVRSGNYVIIFIHRADGVLQIAVWKWA